MKSQKFNSKEIARLSKLPSSPHGDRAYQAGMRLLGMSSKEKVFREWATFTSFCWAEGLKIDPAEVVMLDENASNPPPPDLKCSVGGVWQFFELGEIIQESIAKASAPPKEGRLARGSLPLAKVWGSLQSMLRKKLSKKYDSQGQPLSLLLYYSNHPSFWEFLRPIVADNRVDIQVLLKSSVFDSMFLFDSTNEEVLFRFSRSVAPVIK